MAAIPIESFCFLQKPMTDQKSQAKGIFCYGCVVGLNICEGARAWGTTTKYFGTSGKSG
jgi:hypothetical protein